MSSPGPAAARRGLYRRFFAWLLTRQARVEDERTREFKARTLPSLHGTVIELGAGAGANLRHLPADARVVAVEPNVHAHRHLRREAAAREREVEIRTAVGERLPLEDGAADAVLSSLVLCSVDDVVKVLAEIRRVLRPGGRFVFVEHVGASPGSRLRRWQERVRPLWRWIGDGCEPDRDLEAAIRAAGFARVEVERYRADLPLALVRPHIAGVAYTSGGGDDDPSEVTRPVRSPAPG